jgi:hypothetical protein
LYDIAVGPFIGDFTSEVLLFRPYALWLIDVLQPRHVYIASHKSRKFLYPTTNVTFFPVFENLTRNEFGQDRVVHKDISGHDYNIVIKKFKADVLSVSKASVAYYNIEYNRFGWIPEYKRIMTPLDTTDGTKTAKIIFIPCENEKAFVLEHVYNKLLKSAVCIGDMKTHLPEHNVLLRDPMYFKNVYRNMVDYISSASCVICPSSVWTSICYWHNIPCFSWGRYAHTDINRNSIVLQSDDLDHTIITSRMISWLNARNLSN